MGRVANSDVLDDCRDGALWTPKLLPTFKRWSNQKKLVWPRKRPHYLRFYESRWIHTQAFEGLFFDRCCSSAKEIDVWRWNQHHLCLAG